MSQLIKVIVHFEKADSGAAALVPLSSVAFIIGSEVHLKANCMMQLPQAGKISRIELSEESLDTLGN